MILNQHLHDSNHTLKISSVRLRLDIYIKREKDRSFASILHQYSSVFSNMTKRIKGYHYLI